VPPACAADKCNGPEKCCCYNSNADGYTCSNIDACDHNPLSCQHF
jgi:hypothetical protein